MAETSDIILNMLDKQWLQAQQSENQRSQMTNYTLLICGAIQSYIVQRGFDLPCLVLVILILLIGCWGLLASAKYYERFRLSTCRIGRFIEKLQELDPNANIDNIEQKADLIHKNRYPYLYAIHLHTVWNILHIALIIAGFLNIIVVFLR
jgi:hypothetical protein